MAFWGPLNRADEHVPARLSWRVLDSSACLEAFDAELPRT